jgi:hypothetical protein
MSHLDIGAGGRGISVGGKPFGPLPHGVDGINDYSSWFKSPPFKGDYGGYDGPCLIESATETPRSMIALLFALDHPYERSPLDQTPMLNEDSVVSIDPSVHSPPKRTPINAPLTGQQLLSKSLDHMIAYTTYRWQVTPLRDR